MTEQTFTIAVTNVNEAPTLQAGAVIHVNERLGAGVILTTFAATDPDTGDTFTYAIVGGEGLQRREVDGVVVRHGHFFPS